MSKFELLNQTAIEDFVRGCTFYATGGGGLPKNGIASLMSELTSTGGPGWMSLDQLDDEATVACPFLMGSIAPHSPEVLKEMEGFGFKNSTSINTEKDRMAKSVLELERYTGRKVDAIVPIELAGANTSAAIAAAHQLGIPSLDGDYTGRAIPEIQQTTPYLKGLELLPIASVDEWGNVALIREALNYRVTERIGKLISAGAYGLAGQAGFLFTGKQVKEVIIPNTMTESYELGKFIRESREAGKNPVTELVTYLNGWILLEGEVVSKDDEDKLGYYWGTNTVKGKGKWSADTMKVWFKNENHVCWKNGSPFVTSPDIISLVDLNTGDPIPNPLVEPGQEVAVVALKARPQFRTEKGIDILGPKYFGFDIDYKPIEEVMTQL